METSRSGSGMHWVKLIFKFDFDFDRHEMAFKVGVDFDERVSLKCKHRRRCVRDALEKVDIQAYCDFEGRQDKGKRGTNQIVLIEEF